MAIFTSSLPDKLGVAKNKIIERALRIYLDQINRAEYVRSYKQAGGDIETMMVAEEGMKLYLEQIDDEEPS